jgi:Holliday junction resolvase RusA-like endonuclease
MQLVAEFEVLGQTCVPWSMPDPRLVKGKFKFVAKDERLVAWQKELAASARSAMGAAAVKLGPVMLAIEFYRETPPGKSDGDWWDVRVEWLGGRYVKRGRHEPDLTNLLKGTEDAVAGVVIGNDAQVVAIQTARLYGPQCGVRVRAFALDTGDRPPWQALFEPSAR